MFVSKFLKVLNFTRIQYNKTNMMAYDSAEQSSIIYTKTADNMFHVAMQTVYIWYSDVEKVVR